MREVVLLRLLLPALLSATPSAEPASDERALSLRHTHTDEELSIVYWSEGQYIPEALARVNQFLRDFRTEDVHEIDPALLDILHEVYVVTGSSGVYEVISGYRSPATNKLLRDQGRGVAKNSQHMLGCAIDVRLTDVDTEKLRDVALALKRGGVGYYKKSDFVHMDTGRFRRW